MENLTIGEIAAKANVNASTIRYYESIGLLPETKRMNGQRRYSEDILKRILFIKIGQQAGFSIQELSYLIEGFGEKVSLSTHWHSMALKKRTELKVKQKQINIMINVLEEGLRCKCLTWDDCLLHLD